MNKNIHQKTLSFYHIQTGLWAITSSHSPIFHTNKVFSRIFHIQWFLISNTLRYCWCIIMWVCTRKQYIKLNRKNKYLQVRLLLFHSLCKTFWRVCDTSIFSSFFLRARSLSLSLFLSRARTHTHTYSNTNNWRIYVWHSRDKMLSFRQSFHVITTTLCISISFIS